MTTSQKTHPTGDDVSASIGAIEDPARRADARTLVTMMTRVSGMQPKVWSGGIIGFGAYRYKYESGHEGYGCLVGFAPRRSEFSIYLMGTHLPEAGEQRAALLSRLGKHRMGKACLYVKRLEDIDLEALEELVTLSVATLQAHYPTEKT